MKAFNYYDDVKLMIKRRWYLLSNIKQKKIWSDFKTYKKTPTQATKSIRERKKEKKT